MNRYFNSVKIVLITLICFYSFNANSQEAQSDLKVMTYNIWNGFDWGKDTVRKVKLINWIKSKAPDVLALQELNDYDEEMLQADAAKWGHKYVKLLKPNGYPVGITSNKPITLKERGIKDFWHGFLHIETYDIDFFVVHLSPADVDYRLKEAGILAEKIKSLTNEKFVVLGDFNSHSPFDGDALKLNESLHDKYFTQKDKNNYSNLRLGEFDYSVISTFLAIPAVDVSQKYVQIEDRFTFPTPALIGIYQTAEEVMQNKERIDYILTSATLAKFCTNVTIFNKGITESLSDHFPLMAEFNFK